jgi:hexokinase
MCDFSKHGGSKMDKLSAKTNDFLREIAMHPDLTDIEAATERCLSEMESGLRGEASSLTMIPTYISTHGMPQENTPVIAVDAGGTNLRVALVTFTGGGPVISQLRVFPIPGSRGEVTADMFFEELGDKILPLTAFSDKIGFCFSYPAEIFPDRDGKILRLSKGVSVKGSTGVVIGRTLVEKLREKGAAGALRVVLLNDTVASMMGGAAQSPLTDCDGICGLILGTGFNTCYPERGERIGKLAHADDMIINCETSNFSKLFRGRADEMTDEASENPGIGFCEKMISGAYLGRVITNTAILAARAGLLSANFARIGEPFALPELDLFLRGGENRVSALCTGEDTDVLREIIDSSFERAGKIVCVNIAALLRRCDGGKSAERPFCVVAEGSTFYKSLLLRDKLDKYVEEYIENKLGRYVTFRGGENLTLTGAALAALLN